MKSVKRKIILASRSLWRKRLLLRHGISCRIHRSNFKELRRHRDPKRLVLFNATGKAFDIAQFYKNAIIVGVDTVGVFRGKILGKPKNREGARRMLKQLFGNTHRVVTGLCVIDAKVKKKYSAVSITKVTFRPVNTAELKDYLDSGQWKGKAGSYAIQGRAKKFVEKIEGDVTNVVGLPIERLRKLLQKFEIRISKYGTSTKLHS